MGNVAETSATSVAILPTKQCSAAEQGELVDALSHWRAKALGGVREWEARNKGLSAEKAGTVMSCLPDYMAHE